MGSASLGAASTASVLAAARREWDVVVIGGGNAGLAAAITAGELGRRVLLVEAAPRHLRAGNTRHTRNIRYVSEGPGLRADATYSEQELLEDLRSVGRGPADPDLASLAVRESGLLESWMEQHGVVWQAPLRGTIGLARTNHFFLGGGKALANLYYKAAADLGVTVLYEASVCDLELDANGHRLTVAGPGDTTTYFRSRAIVAASGGFEANLSWLKRYWGAASDNFIVRGTPYNDGAVLARLLDIGAAQCGDPREFHAVAVDARSPKFDGGIATRIDSIPFGIVVNRYGSRFADEGLDIWPKRYASWGGLVARQPDQIAYAIVDSAAIGKFIPPLFPPFSASSIRDLAESLGVDPQTLDGTVREFNAHVSSQSDLNPGRLDHVSTVGLEPPKSNWARRLNSPPFFAIPLRTGITFTYMGVTVNDKAQVLDQAGNPLPNLFAAGEIMSGNILTSGYLAGFGLTIGTVFGRIAGREAASVAS